MIDQNGDLQRTSRVFQVKVWASEVVWEQFRVGIVVGLGFRASGLGFTILIVASCTLNPKPNPKL